MIDKNTVLDFIKRNPKSTFIKIAKSLRIDYNLNKKLTDILNQLIDEKHILQDHHDSTYSAIEKIDEAKGIIRFAAEGKYAFVDNESTPYDKNTSFFIPRIYFNNAMNNDEVVIEVYRYCNQPNAKKFAMVKEIIQRATDKILGILELKDHSLSFKPLHKTYKNFKFIILDTIRDSRINDVVVAKITTYKKNLLEINIIKKIGNISNPMVFVRALSYEKKLPDEFPAEVLGAANLVPNEVSENEIKDRLDLRDELIITIDGEDTKDFDDAISIKKLDNGTFKLGVHIADVSYYVEENGTIDKEALKRGTSIYMVDGVIPMLPEKLSNGICSLNPHVDRLTMSALMTIDENGKTVVSEIKSSVINSKYRLTYKQVNDFFANKLTFEDKNLNKMLLEARELAQIVRRWKTNEGYIDFEIEEPKIILDEEGNVLDIEVKKSGISENMIEDFMVRANEVVASFMAYHKYPILYRVHAKPEHEKIDYFIEILNTLGIIVDINTDKITPKNFQTIVNQIKEKRNDDFLKSLFLKTMEKAYYSPHNNHHFGLASKHYCHFTSPIRRYPDLIVHRIIRNLHFLKRDKREYYENILPEYGKLNSESEQFALSAERDTNDLKYAEYFKSKIGQTFIAQIATIMKFGMFVQFKNKTGALVHISTMKDDDYEANEALTKVIGKNNKNTFKLGNSVAVVITGADTINGKVDAVLSHNYEAFLNDLKIKTFRENKRKNEKQKNHRNRRR